MGIVQSRSGVACLDSGQKRGRTLDFVGFARYSDICSYGET